MNCPCGAIPLSLHIQEGPTLKHAFASGDCCNVWLVEFRTHKYEPHSAESMSLAIKAWNEEKRG